MALADDLTGIIKVNEMKRNEMYMTLFALDHFMNLHIIALFSFVFS